MLFTQECETQSSTEYFRPLFSVGGKAQSGPLYLRERTSFRKDGFVTVSGTIIVTVDRSLAMAVGHALPSRCKSSDYRFLDESYARLSIR